MIRPLSVNRHGRLLALFVSLLLLTGAFQGLMGSDGGRPSVPGLLATPVLPSPSNFSADTIPADTAVADTLRTRADSVRARILDRLQVAPTPGAPIPWLAADPDSALEVDADSLTLEEPEGGLGQLQAGGQPALRVALPAGADSTMMALARLPGYRAASFEGVRMEYSEETGVLLLTGEPAPAVPAPGGDSLGVTTQLAPVPDSAMVTDTAAVVEGQPEPEAGVPEVVVPAGIPARFSGDGVRLEADSAIVYDDASGIVRTRGSTLFTPERGDPVRSRSLVYDVRASRGTALGAQTRYAQGGGEWFVLADMDSVEDGVIFSSGARFTTDDRPQPNSHFEASELKVVAENILVARSVRLHFQEVPVLWLPFIVQPLQSERSSGILAPQFSVNDIVRTSGDYRRRLSNVGFYWAISDYADATLAGDWWSGQYTALTGSLRYRWSRQFLGGDVAVRHFWREEGQRDLAISASNGWEPTERARANLAVNYVSNSGLVRQNSLDARELTASINSQAGFQQRFDWGSGSIEARRQQYLTDDRVEMTLPSATLSIATFTLFPAGSSDPRWYNNVTVGASTSFGRDILQPGAPRPDEPFRFTQLENIRTQGSLRSSITLANLSMSGNATYRENAFTGVPDIFARPIESLDGLPFPGLDGNPVLDPLSRPRVNYADAEVSWSASLSYQQRIIGTTSISPTLTLSGQFFRSDSIGAAQSFVESPARIAFGASTQAELYGFFPGFGEFDLIRHKVTPSASFSYAPEVAPTDLQVQVFGARALGPQKTLTFGFNQTFEARRIRPADPTDTGEPGSEDEAVGISGEDPPTDPSEDPRMTPVQDPAEPESLVQERAVQAAPTPGSQDWAGQGVSAPILPTTAANAPGQRRSILDEGVEGFRQPEPTQVVTLLGLSTSALAYDLVRADSTGFWLDGFTTLELRNSVRSDYLRGLNFSFSHLLFEDPRPDSGTGEGESVRRFKPFLAQVSLGFSLDNNSSLIRSIGRFVGISSGEAGSSEEGRQAREDQLQQGEGTFDEGATGASATDGFNSDRVLPGLAGGRGEDGIAPGSWNANLNYSLRRPREGSGGIRAQMLNGTISFRATDLLSVNWATAYDFETRSFTDHTIQVARDMYDWEASFGFRQAVNGNWTFQFEVSLKANRDLHFDYEQRNLDQGISQGGRPGFF